MQDARLVGIGKFVPAHWTIPENYFAGVGTLVAATHRIPENYFRPALGTLIDNYRMWPSVPNPIVTEIEAKIAALIQKSQEPPVGLSCGIGDCPCEVGLCGMAGPVDDVLQSVTSGGWQTWALVAAGVGALILFTGGGGSQRRSEISAAKAQYRAKVARIKAERPRRYQRFV